MYERKPFAAPCYDFAPSPVMSRTARFSAAVVALAIVVTPLREAEGQVIRFGRFGGLDRPSLGTPSLSIAVSPWGTAIARPPHGGGHLLATPFAPYPYEPFPGIDSHSAYHGYPSPDLYDPASPPRGGFSRHAPGSSGDRASRYLSPQERYTMPIRPYGTASGFPNGSPYSLGAPLRPDDRGERPELKGPLPFARSPYDDGEVQGFGVTGTAPARSLSDRELASALRRAASELDIALAAEQDGDVWQEYLQPALIADLFRPEGSGVVDEDLLRSLSVNFEATTGNEDLRWVTAIDGFTRTRQLLNEWLRRQSESDIVGRDAVGGETERTVEVEELPAPLADPSPTDLPETDPPRRYEL